MLLSWGIFQFTIEALESMELAPEKESALRGALGHQLRKTVCLTKMPTCEGCPYLSSCIYAYFYETLPPPNASLMRLYRNAPHPYVFEVDGKDAEKRRVLPGETFSFRMVLIGKAVDFLPHLIFAMEQAGKNGLGKNRGRFYLKSVANCLPEGDPVPLYEGRFLDKAQAQFSWDPTSMASSAAQAVEIHFSSPVRIKKEGKYGAELEFSLLLRSLLVRLQMLSYFHCGQEFTVDGKALVEQAHQIEIAESHLQWQEVNRYSYPQQASMKLGGFVGQIRYRGELGPFLPYLAAGRYLHVGKNTTFGLGRYTYRIEV